MRSKFIASIIDFLVLQMARTNKKSLPQLDRLNLGSAYNVAPGWVNIDNSPSVWLSKHNTVRHLLQKVNLINESTQQSWQVDLIFHDVRHGLPWPDQSVRYIYTSHLLEHLSPQGGERLLQECYRVMKSGGILRVVVPDLMLYAQHYIDAITSGASKCEDIPSFSATENFLEIVGVHFGNTVSFRCPHRWMYDACSLARYLAKVGFVKIEQKAYREGRVPDLEILDTRPDDSLHMEAERP
jgi:predicted SAM-dependent methyltransferase